MRAKISKLLLDFNKQLNFIDLEIDNQFICCENAIDIISKTINNLKIIVKKQRFIIA